MIFIFKNAVEESFASQMKNWRETDDGNPSRGRHRCLLIVQYGCPPTAIGARDHAYSPM